MEKMERSPTRSSERIASLDVLRGFAVLGILIMNIQAFSMVGAAYMNPTAYGDFTGANFWTWLFSHILADSKFYALFSILFGAGVVLMTSRAEAKNGKSAGLHYRRTLWLGLIGLIHAYLLWYGDILVLYTLCSLVLYLFRKVRPGWLVAVGSALITVSVLLSLFFGWSMPYWPEESIQEVTKSWNPAPEMIEEEIGIYTETWSGQLEHRVPQAFMIQTFLFLIGLGWKLIGIMFIGMALFKWGILSGERSRKFYFLFMLCGFITGFPIVLWGVIRNFSAGWSLSYSMFIGSQFNGVGSLLVAGGYIGMIMLFCQTPFMAKLLSPLASVGRMALSNYLIMTLICTTIFYSQGLALYGKVERIDQILIVLAIWVFLILASTAWLKWFRYGPFEWLWRSLTYGRILQIRK